MYSVNNGDSADGSNRGKPSEIDFGDDISNQTPSTISGVTIHSSNDNSGTDTPYTNHDSFSPPLNADVTRKQRVKSNLEQSGRHKKYLSYGGGVYAKKSFDDSSGMFSLVCGMGRINCAGEMNNWELMRDIKRIPPELKERCEGELCVTVDDVSGEESITLVASHTCRHKCRLVAGMKTTVLEKSCSQLSVDNSPQLVHKSPGGSEFQDMGTQHLFQDSDDVEDGDSGKEAVTNGIDNEVDRFNISSDLKIDDDEDGDATIEMGARVNVSDPGLLRVGDVDVVRDYRPPLMLFMDNPQSPFIADSDKRELMSLLKKRSKTMFTGLVGGIFGKKTHRHYTADLKSYPDVYKLVERCMSRYIAEVQSKYPKLKYYKLAVVRSAPKAKSQYHGNNCQLHSDYDCIVNLRPPDERPVSLLVALDEFEFMYLQSREHTRKDIITQNVLPGQAVAFTNYCLHAGGPNDTTQYRHRMFAYLVSNEVDFPYNRVYNFLWKSVTEDEMDDIIVERVHEVPVGHDAKRTRSGRVLIPVEKD